MGRCFPSPRARCWQSGAHLRRGDGVQRWQAGVVLVPVPHHSFEVLQLQSSTLASAETFLRSSAAGSAAGTRGWGQTQHWEEAGRGCWLVRRVGCIGRNGGTYSHAHGGSRQAELWMKVSAEWLTHVKSTRARGTENHLSASNHTSTGHSSSVGLLLAPQASREEKPRPHMRSL